MKIIISLTLLILLNTPLSAEPLFIDAAIAIVEDDIITNTELSREVNRIRKELTKNGRQIPADTALNRQVLELMINQSILRQQADSRGISITDTQLNSTLQGMARRNKLTLEKFRMALIKSGIDYNKFREDIRNEMAINSSTSWSETSALVKA